MSFAMLEARARSVNAEQHRARESTLGRRHRIERRQRKPARPANERKIGAEQVHEAVCESDARESIGPTPPCVRFEHRWVAQRVARGVDDRVRKLERIANAEI